MSVRANGTFVNAVENCLNRRRTPIERQLKDAGIHEAGLRQHIFAVVSALAARAAAGVPIAAITVT